MYLQDGRERKQSRRENDISQPNSNDSDSRLIDSSFKWMFQQSWYDFGCRIDRKSTSKPDRPNKQPLILWREQSPLTKMTRRGSTYTQSLSSWFLLTLLNFLNLLGLHPRKRNQGVDLITCWLLTVYLLLRFFLDKDWCCEWVNERCDF